MTWLKSLVVKEKLKLVEAEMAKAIHCDDPFVSEVCSYLFKSRGKRLRPALLLLAAQFGKADNPDTLSTAAAVELLHLATLYHDDIIDESSNRRCRLTVNSRWGNRVAVFAGTYLFAKANELLAAAGDEINQAASRAVNNVWQGQMQEVENVYNLDLEEKSFFNIIEQKTATFFELSCRLGALVSISAPKHKRILIEYGRNLGIAFQLVDDVMDLVADESHLGKAPGTDLQEGVYTLPILYTLRSKGPEGEKLRAILACRDSTREIRAEALEIVISTGGIEYTTSLARSFSDQAKRCLQSLPAGSETESLFELADLVVNRQGPMSYAKNEKQTRQI